MIIAEATSGQEIKFISRVQNTSGAVTITDKQKNTTTTYLVTSYGKERHYTTVTLDLSALSNERKYLFIANCQVTGEMFRGVLFLTAQDPDTYSINDGLYTEPTSTNEYLVAE